MHKINVFWNGKKLREIYPHASTWQILKWRLKRLFRKTIIVLGFIFLLVGTFKVGGFVNSTSYAVEVEKIVEAPIKAVVLDRIAGCESEGNPNSKGVHYDKNGQVLMRANNNGTVDVGKYQINSVWFKKASELGLDLTKEKDNEQMAMWIYTNRGTEDWYPSKKCWQK